MGNTYNNNENYVGVVEGRGSSHIWRGKEREKERKRKTKQKKGQEMVSSSSLKTLTHLHGYFDKKGKYFKDMHIPILAWVS